MRRLFLALLLGLSLLGQAEEIRDFSVTLAIGGDGVVEVTEEISVFFDFPRHGIVREIPTSYRLPTGETFRLRLELEGVTVDGDPVPFQRSWEGGNLILKIGNPEVTVSGLVPYTIRYRMLRALRRYEDEVELYWNAIGTEWSMPIRNFRVEVIPPPGVDQDSLRWSGYQGRYGSTFPFELRFADGKLFGAGQDLLPGQGVTVAVRVPASAVSLPGLGQEILWFLEDNVYAAIPLFILLGMIFVWWRWGRDPKLGTVAPEFTPPPGVGPAEAGFLVDDRFDPRDFAAGILSLAVKGWLRIREEDGDFEFVSQEGEKDLTPYEDALREALLAGKESRQLSQLKYKMYEKMSGLSAKLVLDLVGRGFYRGNPDAVRQNWWALGAGILVIGAILGVFTSSLYLGLAVGISGVIVLLFAPFMPRKTELGMEALRRIRGLSEYIQRAEVERMEFAAKEKHFEELLPYAEALGLTEVWTDKFAGLLREPPRWYEGRGPWVPAVFGTRILALERAAYAAATTAPRTARSGRGWSGGSGFGGGGFSGGGMGGGGGRSW